MIPAAVMVKLATLGLTAEHAEAVAQMLAAVEQATKAESGSEIEARRAADRERKARQRHGKSRDVTGQDGTIGTDPSPKRKVSPCTPSKENTPNPSSEPDGSSEPAAANAKPSARIELARVLDDRHAADILDHRKRIGAPLTASAAAKLAAKLARCDDPNGAADEMLANGWRGFEPEWLERRKGGLRVVAGQQAPPQSARERLMDTGRQMLAEERGEAEQQPWHGSTIDGIAQRRQ